MILIVAINFRKMDLNLFLVLDAVYSHRNLTRAAEQLHITQPAVSNALARLRQQLDDHLFTRSPEGMTPTSVTENIMPQVQQALALLGNSVSKRNAFDPATANRTFRISMNDMAEGVLLPRLMERMGRIAPGIGIESYYVPRDDLTRELAANTLDLGIDVPMAEVPLLHQQRLNKDPHVVMVRPEHPLAKQKSLSLEHYLSLGHVHVSTRRSGAGIVDMALARAGVQRNIQLRVRHFHAAPAVVQQTNLALTVPEVIARQYPGKLFKAPFDIPQIDWYLFWHRNLHDEAANVWLRTQVSDLFGK